VARSGDGGRTWTVGGDPAIAGAAYGAAYLPGAAALVLVGPGGASWSADDGRSWARLDSLASWGLGFADRRGWIVGPRGRVTRVRLP
jgi:photosystem II stability/assembly factor-like uncharacterized protein